MRLFALSLAAAVSMLTFGAGSQAAHAAPNQTKEKEASAQMVTIQPGDSLSKIAKEEDSTVKRLFYANQEIEDPDVIYPDEELRVPGEDEKLEPRPIPGNAVAAPVATPAPQPAAPQATTTAYQAPQPDTTPAAPAAPSGGVWDRLAQCESGGNWSINTGNGFYGGLQFTPSSWAAAGGSGSPQNASRAEQIAVAKNLQSMQGWGAWPACSAKLGLR